MDWKREIKLFIVRFLLVGLFGITLDILMTQLDAAFKLTIGKPWYDFFGNFWKVEGRTGIIAIFMYGCVVFPYTFLRPLLLKFSNFKGGIFIRSIFYALCFFLIEFLFGLINIGIAGKCPWDYSAYPLNVMGLITFVFFPIWYLGGIGGEWIHRLTLIFDDIIIDQLKELE